MTQALRDRRPADDGRWGILLGISAIALVTVVCLDALAVSETTPRLIILILTVAVIAERSADARTALGAGLLAWPMGNGFLENQAGVLQWHTATDFPLALGLLGAVAVGMCAAQTRTAWQRRQREAESLPCERGRDHPLRKRQDPHKRSGVRPTVRIVTSSHRESSCLSPRPHA